ncbi:MAG: hypothetical protein KC413_17125 [Anaerolineales bacterium]|nr:hypothetical protein [Anaerolineales bacterium]MCA9977486.1 hypothetical protein [Anaerolineales bacterium]
MSDACAQPGCPICRLAHRTVQRHLDKVIYDSVNDPATRAQLRESFGYCYEHAWQLTQTGEGTAVGVAFIYRDMLNAVTKILEKAGQERPSRPLLAQVQEKVNRTRANSATANLTQQLVPGANCLACAERDKMVDLALITLTDALGKADEKMESALHASDGLCVPHLRQALALCRSDTAVTTLLSITITKLHALQAELTEFLRKNDYRFRGEGFGDEADSWLRAVSTTIGTIRPE